MCQVKTRKGRMLYKPPVLEAMPRSSSAWARTSSGRGQSAPPRTRWSSPSSGAQRAGLSPVAGQGAGDGGEVAQRPAPLRDAGAGVQANVFAAAEGRRPLEARQGEEIGCAQRELERLVARRQAEKLDQAQQPPHLAATLGP